MDRIVRDISFQIKYKSEEKDLKLIKEFEKLGWIRISTLRLSNEVYFLHIHWPNNESPIYPAGYQI